MEPTARSLRCALASGSGSCPALRLINQVRPKRAREEASCGGAAEGPRPLVLPSRGCTGANQSNEQKTIPDRARQRYRCFRSAVLRYCEPPRRVRRNPSAASVLVIRHGLPKRAGTGLRREVRGRLITVESPLTACQTAPEGASCTEVFKALKNPYYIGDQPALTQTSGWVDAWTSAPSVYAVAAAETADVVAAVNFAREHHLRLVVKGGGHSYQGTSNSADSLLIWTRAMNGIVLHDAFVPQGCAGTLAPQPAVTVGAGAIWMHVYDAVTTQAGRYVQGGGCTTVGVAGLIQSGGFGSFSKTYGLAAAGLLEAEVVTADGAVRIANACTNPDLFWALKGGGGGSFGVVTRLTLRTRELPDYFGGVFGTIKANSETAFRRLTARIIGFYHDHLFNRHWGEQIRFEPGNTRQDFAWCSRG